jgi:hypothetical protein
MDSKFGNGLKIKVVDISKMNNFDVLSFLSLNIKFKVILNLQKKENVPF